VHKAIRRLTPAPKARPQRSGTLESKDSKPLEHQGLGNAQYGNEPGHNRVGSISAKSDFAALASSPKTATFLMRRSSAGADGRPSSTVPVKANLEEMRQQLRHLGPSNRASNPKNTKSTTVKIKTIGSGLAHPALLPISRPSSAAGETIEGQVEEHHDEHTPLIQTNPSGKDGVHAIGRTYGGAGMSEVQGRLSLQTPDVRIDLTDHNEEVEVHHDDDGTAKKLKIDATDPGNQTMPSHRVELGASLSPSGSHDSLSSLRSNGANTPRRRHLVRSGSITENIFEMGGVQKIVIQTASSEDDNEGPRAAGPSKKAATGESEEDADDEPTSPSQADRQPSASSQPGEAGSVSADGPGQGKKKNRRKKRKGNR
jgi:metal transporter CNNM